MTTAGAYAEPMTDLSNDAAALAAHKIVLAHLVSEAQARLGAEASSFLSQIRQAAISSISRAESAGGDADADQIKRLIIEAIDDIFGPSDT